MHITKKAKIIFAIFTVSTLLIFSACSQTHVSSLSPISSIDKSQRIALYSLDNYTDTPRAGMRAANIVEGLLLAKGYRVDNRINNDTLEMTQQEKLSDATNRQDGYIFVGGVSEWRYKTGIDGEPAVSLQLRIIDIKTSTVVWSAVASDSSWGNASIGTLSQDLISSMLNNK